MRVSEPQSARSTVKVMHKTAVSLPPKSAEILAASADTANAEKYGKIL